MDGNRRWARAQGLPDFDGHAAGVEAIRGLLQHAVRRGVPMLTIYAFSRENWARSDDEVSGLFDLLGHAIASETDELAPRASGSGSWAASTSCRRRPAAIDRRRPGPHRVGHPAPPQRRVELRGPDGARRRVPARSPPRASHPTRSTSGRSARRCTRAACPDPDLVIRTGGEQRISNFLIWQSAYAELVFADCLWPDFGPERLRRGAARVRPPHAPVRPVAREVLRTRALSALVLVPVLLVALCLGLWAIAAVLVLVARFGGIEVFRLLRGAGYPSLALFGTALAVAFVLEACVPPGRRQGHPAARGGRRARRGRRILADRPARRAGRLVRDRVRRRLRRPDRPSSSSSARRGRRCPTARRSRASAPSGAGSCCSSSACGATTRARTSSVARSGATSS